MDQVEIQKFIASHKAKLDEEKARLGQQQRSPRGILPEDTQASKRDRQRQERQSEYREFLKQKEGGLGRTKSLTEIRHQMQRDREEELGRIEAGQVETGKPRSQLRGPDENQRMPGGNFDSKRGFERAMKEASEYGLSGDHYLDLKEQRLAEEQHYRGQLHDSPRTKAFTGAIGRRRWDEDEQPSHRVRFEDDTHFARGRGPNSQRWEDDERDLMQWAKSKDHSRHRLPTPPYESPRKQEGRLGKGSQRSISAPLIAEGIARLGVRDDPVALRNRQQEYAEELRAQIREQEEARKREKMELHGTSPKHEVTQTTQTPERRPPELTDKPPKHSSSRNGRSSPRDDRDRSDTMDYSRKPPRSSYDRHERYSPYPAPHYADYPGYYPQMDYPRPWIPPYYQPRPVYPPPPNLLTDPYYPPSQPPHMGNPYLYHGRPGPEFLDADFRGRRRPEETDRRQRDQSPKHKDTQEDYSDTSPLAGGGSGRKTKQQSKASYKAELEQQIQEKKEKDTKGRIELESFELKEAEIYDPWGKGGCGAPVRDYRGKLVADLKKMRQINNDKLLRGPSRAAPAPPSHTPGIGDDEIDFDVSGSPSRPQYTYSSHEAREKEESEELHTKSQQEEYREFLRKQVEEKEANKMREKEEKMAEEQRELERLEKERKIMQDDYKHEVETQRRKEDELHSKNEALKREAEEKRRATALKQQQEELREAELEAEKQKLALAKKMEQLLSNPPQQRSNSPPIPALMHKRGGPPTLNPPTTETIAQTTTFRSSSPPVPALQHKHMRPSSEYHPVGIPEDKDTPPFRTNSPPVPTLRKKMLAGTSVNSNPPLAPKPPTPWLTAEPTKKVSEQERQESLRHLSAMRYHLTELTRKQHRSSKSSSSEDTANVIFDMVKCQKPRMVAPRTRKPPKENDGSLSAALKEFGELKQTTSSKEIMAKFSSAPETSSMLEYQQDALLRHQEDRIARLRVSGRDNRNHDISASSRGSRLLTSESTHVPIEDPFSETGVEPSHLSARNPTPPIKQWPLRNGSAGARSQFSVATMEVDRMARRNEERGRRLDAILNADARAKEGRQTVIHNFLQQTDQRRPSEESLDCETGFHPISSAHS